MAKKRRRSRRAGPARIILGILLSVALAGAGVVGVRVWAADRPQSAALRREEPISGVVLDLYVPGDAVINPAPEAAAAPELSAVEPSDGGFAQILGQEEGLTVAKILGKRYIGYVALVEDPSRVMAARSPYFSESVSGRTVDQMANEHGAVLAVNGGGFMDVGGVGTGGMPTGNVVIEGTMAWAGGGSTVAMDYEGKLHVGEMSGNYCNDQGFRWALSYGPTLIEDGAIRPNLDARQQEPRTAVGQRADGTVVIMNIQGRQASALGVTLQELAEIMELYGCVNAGNLDGGASSDMYYRGEYVNVCNISSGPRPIPTSLLVMPAAGEEAQG